MDIPDSVFEAVHDGMQGVMETGTGAYAKVPGIIVCGKTGTVENAYKGVKQKDHAFFAAFAPRDNPKIAIAVICENAGFGASSAGVAWDAHSRVASRGASIWRVTVAIRASSSQMSRSMMFATQPSSLSGWCRRFHSPAAYLLASAIVG